MMLRSASAIITLVVTSSSAVRMRRSSAARAWSSSARARSWPTISPMALYICPISSREGGATRTSSWPCETAWMAPSAPESGRRMERAISQHSSSADSSTSTPARISTLLKLQARAAMSSVYSPLPMIQPQRLCRPT